MHMPQNTSTHILTKALAASSNWLSTETDCKLNSGGNTLFAMDFWRALEVDKLFHEAAARGVVLCGGSAGAICWFDGGHSDSQDPATHLSAMTRKGEQEKSGNSQGNPDNMHHTYWEYIRVGGLGLLPGLCCPHQDQTQSNGVLRSADFEQMLLRHSGETGVCIDHFAALIIDGEDYYVMQIGESPTGSVLLPQVTSESRQRQPEFTTRGNGIPGVWKRTVSECHKIQLHSVPAQGKCKHLFQPAKAIVDDPRLETARLANPVPL